MGGSLFLKECRIISKSILYYILSIFIIGFIVFQMKGFKSPKPIPDNPKGYGYKVTTDSNKIMNETMKSLVDDYLQNDYVTYPISFAKHVHLDSDKKNEVEKVIGKYIGCKDTEVKKVLADDTKEIKIKSDADYSSFMKDMKQLDEMLGGYSGYSEENIKKNSTIKATYEDAMKDYYSIVNDDHISSAYAREFCDFGGIILGFLPVFLAVARCISDKKSKTEDVIFSSNASSFSIIISRYLAVVIMLLIPVMIAAVFIDSQCIYYAHSIGIQPYYLSFTEHILGWLLPSIMFAVAVGFFFSELTGGVIGILVQGIYWFGWMNHMREIRGSVGWSIVPRYNMIGERHIFESIYNQLVVNRSCYAVISIVLLLLTVIIFNLKRNGRLNSNGKRISNIKS